MSSWHWRYEKSDGALVAPIPDVATQEHFPMQGDAESWLGETWRELLAAGIDAVTLLEGDRIVYGPMKLTAE